MTKYYNVTSKHSYVNPENEEKNRYFTIGILKITPTGGMYLRLWANPSVEYFVFEQRQPDDLPTINADAE